MNDYQFIEAQTSHLEAIIKMLSDDELGQKREQFELPLPKSYIKAFNAILEDPNAKLIVVLDKDKVIGVAQLNFLTYLTYQGGRRAQIEGVRVDSSYRGQGIGKKLFEHLIDLAKHEGCHMVQLTTNQARSDAYRFYEQLGFKHTHAGFKLEIGC